MQEVNFPCLPWHQLAIDVKGPVSDSSALPYYVIVLVDYYTKVTRCRVARQATAGVILSFLEKTSRWLDCLRPL